MELFIFLVNQKNEDEGSEYAALERAGEVGKYPGGDRDSWGGKITNRTVLILHRQNPPKGKVSRQGQISVKGSAPHYGTDRGVKTSHNREGWGGL